MSNAFFFFFGRVDGRTALYLSSASRLGGRVSAPPREVPQPGLHLVDTGLLAYLLGADAHRIANDDQVTGRILENFVAMEVVKHCDWAAVDTRAYHYRDGRDEVDLVLESRSGDITAIEVKAGASLDARDWRGLAKLRDRTGERFRSGIVTYTGQQTLPLGDRLWAVPISGLWAT